MLLWKSLHACVHGYTHADEAGNRYDDDDFRVIIPIGWSLALSLSNVAIHLIWWLPLLAGMFSDANTLFWLLAVVLEFFVVEGVALHRLLRLTRLPLLSMLLYRNRLFLEEQATDANRWLLRLAKLSASLMVLMLPKLVFDAIRMGLIREWWEDNGCSETNNEFVVPKSWRNIWRRLSLFLVLLVVVFLGHAKTL